MLWPFAICGIDLGEYGSSYTTLVYDRNAGTATSLETGWTKTYKVALDGINLSTLVGAGYSVKPEERLNIYFWLYWE